MWLWYDPSARELKLGFDDGLDDAESLTLHVGGVSLRFPENSGGDSSFTFEDVDLAWSDGETLAVRISQPSAAAVSTDATLAALAVGGAALSPAFDTGVLVYRAAVGAGVETVTVTVAASANDRGAAVTYGPAADADPALADHQVAAPVGETLITVTAADGQTQRAYRVVVKRPPTVAVSFGSASYTATEGGDAASVIVELGADPKRDVTIPLTASPAGGAAADDYTVAGSVTFTSGGALSQGVVVTAVADDTAESGESVVLGFRSLPDGVEAGATTSAAVTLADAAAEAVGTLAVSFTVAAGEAADADALTASFTGVPAEHGGPGSEPFTFRVLFSEDPAVGYRVLRDQGAFEVTGGTVKKAKRVDGRDDLREIHIAPSGWDDVTVMLAGGRHDGRHLHVGRQGSGQYGGGGGAGTAGAEGCGRAGRRGSAGGAGVPGEPEPGGGGGGDGGLRDRRRHGDRGTGLHRGERYAHLRAGRRREDGDRRRGRRRHRRGRGDAGAGPVQTRPGRASAPPPRPAPSSTPTRCRGRGWRGSDAPPSATCWRRWSNGSTARRPGRR